MAENADADIPAIENDEFKKDEIKVEMKSGSTDSNPTLSEILERPISGHRVRALLFCL